MNMKNNIAYAFFLTLLTFVDSPKLFAEPAGDASQIRDDKITDSLRSDTVPTLTHEQGLLGNLRLDVLTDKFVILPKPPCVGEGKLREERTLVNGC